MSLNHHALLPSSKSSCFICRKCFDNPKVLPCSHTFCEECVREYITSRGYDVFGFFPCPTCHVGITIPSGGINEFHPYLNMSPMNSKNDIEKIKTIASVQSCTTPVSRLKDPQGLSCTKNNLIVVSDKYDSKIMIFDMNYQLVSCFLCKEKIYSCITSFNDTLLVTNIQIGQPLLLEFDLTGQRCGIKTTLNKMEATYGVTVLKEPMQYVVSVVESSSLYVLDEHGKLLKKITGKALLGQPFNLCTNQLNDIIVSDKLNHCIKILNRNGKLKTSIGHMGTSKDCLFEPAGLCTDQHNNIIIADSGNRCVKLFSKCGKFIRTLADFDCHMEKPVNVTLTKDYEHIIILLTGNKPRIVIEDYRPPPNGMVQCIT